MRRVVDELAALTAAVNGDAADAGRAEELARSAAALRTALGSATETVSGVGGGLPNLASQLSDAVAALREAKGGSASNNPSAAKVERILPKLEAAMAALRDAASSSETESSLASAAARIEALPKQDEDAAAVARDAQEQVAGPALQAIEKGVGRLQEVLTELESAVGAAREADLPSAPALRD